jgi:hypothetical protein
MPINRIQHLQRILNGYYDYLNTPPEERNIPQTETELLTRCAELKIIVKFKLSSSAQHAVHPDHLKTLVLQHVVLTEPRFQPYVENFTDDFFMHFNEMQLHVLNDKFIMALVAIKKIDLTTALYFSDSCVVHTFQRWLSQHIKSLPDEEQKELRELLGKDKDDSSTNFAILNKLLDTRGNCKSTDPFFPARPLLPYIQTECKPLSETQQQLLAATPLLYRLFSESQCSSNLFFQFNKLTDQECRDVCDVLNQPLVTEDLIQALIYAKVTLKLLLNPTILDGINDRSINILQAKPGIGDLGGKSIEITPQKLCQILNIGSQSSENALQIAMGNSQLLNSIGKGEIDIKNGKFVCSATMLEELLAQSPTVSPSKGGLFRPASPEATSTPTSQPEETTATQPTHQ